MLILRQSSLHNFSNAQEFAQICQDSMLLSGRQRRACGSLVLPSLGQLALSALAAHMLTHRQVPLRHHSLSVS
jgi:hypothetical protein